MKKYFIRHWQNFSNAYDIVSVESETDKQLLASHQNDWQRIPFSEVKKKISLERQKRKYDMAFSGYAPTEIAPISNYYSLLEMEG